MKPLWLIALALGAAACAQDRPLTQIAITVDSDIAPALDVITLEVAAAPDKVLKSSAELDKAMLPRKLTLVHEDGPLGPFTVTATGWRNDLEIVEFKRKVEFAAERTWTLPIKLEQRCVAKWASCGDDQTCERGDCGPIETANAPAKDAPTTDTGTGPGGALGPGDEPQTSMPPFNLRPSCTIDEPQQDQRLFKGGNDLELKGHCSDESALPDDALRWVNSDGVELGQGPSLEIKADKVELGDLTLMLCATDPMRLRGCSDTLTIQVLPKPQPPRGKIDVVRQGDITAPGPFSTEDPISLEASGTSGARFSWWDNFMGDVSGDEHATLSSPPIGRHQVILTVTDEALQTYTDKIEFDVLDATRFEAGGHLIEPFQTINDELSASGDSSVIALATDSSGLGFVSNGQQVYTFQSDSQDAAPSPLSIDSQSSETITLDHVTAILVWENGDDSRLYLGSAQGVLSCAYTLGTTPIRSDSCQRHQNMDGQISPDGAVSALARLSIGDRNWLAIGTGSGLFVSADEDGRMGDVMVVTSDQEPIRGVVAEGGSFWFATEYNGIYQYDVMAGQIPSLFSTDAPPPPFTALALDPSGGGIWLGSAGHGLGHFESGTGRWQGLMAGDRSESLASNTVQAISTGYGLSQGLSREVIWVGTDRGLTRLDPVLPVFTTLTTDAGLPSDDVRAITIAGQSGYVLVGTSAGLALYNGS